MLDANDFIRIVKKAALDAVNASQPTDFCVGKVASLKPLKISVDQKLTLKKTQLIATETVMTTSPLEVGDMVVLLQKQGGQKYLIMDKVVSL